MTEHDRHASPANDPRAFNSAQRIALYLAADGKCQQCGTDLVPGWHADHVLAYSRGGPTDVINGQALCPSCNLKKGSRNMTTLREWQLEAQSRWQKKRDQEDFLCVATPGAGKTRFALTVAKDDAHDGITPRVIIVAPRVELKRQWADAAAVVGLTLDPFWDNTCGALAADCDGIVTTYQAVASSPLPFRRLAAQRPTLLIADEIHHCGVDEDHAALIWGPRLGEAFGPCVRRLLLSGTPFRSDNFQIPFVRYELNAEDQIESVADYHYGYAAAVRDGVCRSIDFRTYDGEVRWLEGSREVDCDGTKIAQLTTDLKGEKRARAVQTALVPHGEWMPGLLKEADHALTAMREEQSDAGGLCLAYRQETAREYASILAEITGEQPTVIVSDDPQSPDKLARFRDGKTRWLVAVDMVSEGVDIPRLGVEVLATQKSTELFFRQAIGRVVRRTGDEDVQAVVFMPRIQPLVGFAQTIAEEQSHLLDEARDDARKSNGSDGNPTTFTFIGSDDARFAGSYLSGEEFTPEAIIQAERECQRAGIPVRFAAATLRLERKQMSEAPTTTVTIETQPQPRAQYRVKSELKSALTKAVGMAAYRTKREPRDINTQLWRAFGKSRSQLTVDELEKQIQMAKDIGR